MIKDPDSVHCFMIVNVGMVVGKPIVDNNRIVGIKNARLTQANNEKKSVGFAPFFGNKEEIYLGNMEFMFWVLIDKQILDLYKQHMSGLIVTNQMPPAGPKLVKP